MAGSERDVLREAGKALAKRTLSRATSALWLRMLPYAAPAAAAVAVLTAVTALVRKTSDAAGLSASELDRLRFMPDDEALTPAQPSALPVPTQRPDTTPAPAPRRAAPVAPAAGAPQRPPRQVDVARVVSGAKTLEEMRAVLGGVSVRAPETKRGYKGVQYIELDTLPRGMVRKINATPEEQQSVAYVQEKGGSFASGRGLTDAMRTMLEEVADRHSIPRDVFVGIALYESGGNPNAVAAVSSSGGAGGVGLFQFVGSTARGYNLANRFDPLANAEAGARLYNDNKRELEARLKRPAEPWEVYLAHQQGYVGAYNILRSAADNTIPLPEKQRENIAAQYRSVRVSPEDVAREHAEYTRRSFQSKVDKAAKAKAATKDAYPVTPGYVLNPDTGTVERVRERPASAEVPPAPAVRQEQPQPQPKPGQRFLFNVPGLGQVLSRLN